MLHTNVIDGPASLHGGVGGALNTCSQNPCQLCRVSFRLLRPMWWASIAEWHILIIWTVFVISRLSASVWGCGLIIFRVVIPISVQRFRSSLTPIIKSCYMTYLKQSPAINLAVCQQKARSLRCKCKIWQPSQQHVYVILEQTVCRKDESGLNNVGAIAQCHCHS